MISIKRVSIFTLILLGLNNVSSYDFKKDPQLLSIEEGNVECT